jgi:succinate-semialdehyde dehydrogenase/glutarate-semialdehyde dehydrogenase
LLSTLSRRDLVRAGNFIDGAWRAAQGGEWHAVADPASLATIAHVPDSAAADAAAAVDAAHAAFEGWRARSGRERSQLLRRWHALILANQEDLARIISAEQGKPLQEARGEVLYGAAYVEWFAEEAARIHGDVIPQASRSRRMLATREPVGVVAAITPWNFPLAMIARKLAPALAAGCTVVAKPAEDTPLTAAALVALAEEAGFPAGTINLVCASRPRTPGVVDVWLADARVRKITFTGSTPVGKHLARASADTLKRLSLELGGNAPFIVFEDANLDAAVDGLMMAKFRNGGQTCVCPNRVLVHTQVHDSFVDLLTARVAALRVGPASDADAQIGPMINARAVDKMESHVRDALRRGAKVAVGGQRLRAPQVPGAGHYFAPTVLTDVDGSMLCAVEETFGPVVALSRFGSEDEAVRLANDTPYGLAAYFYSADAARIARVAERLEAGIVGINEGALAAEAAPFGGIRESGYGREGSRHGLDDYLQWKYQCQGGLS